MKQHKKCTTFCGYENCTCVPKQFLAMWEQIDKQINQHEAIMQEKQESWISPEEVEKYDN